MKLYRYVDHQRLHIVTKDVISLSISVLLLFRHYISHKITFGAPSSGGVLRSACGAFIFCLLPVGVYIDAYVKIRSYVLCVSTPINYTLATEENVHHVRVCACCNHFPIT